MRDISDNGCISRQPWGWAMDSRLWSLQHEDHVVGTDFSTNHSFPVILLTIVYHSQSKSIKHSPDVINPGSNTHIHIKHKYSVWESTFIFKVASEEGEPNWLNVGELDPGRIGRSRGCCAEALVFVRTLILLSLSSIPISCHCPFIWLSGYPLSWSYYWLLASNS